MARRISKASEPKATGTQGAERALAPDEKVEIIKKLGGQPAPVGVASQAVLWNVPQFYGTSITAFLAANDFVVTVARPHPATVPGLAEGTAAAVTEPIAVLHLSPGTMKDLYLLTKTQIEAYEKEYGKVETEYSRRVEGKK